MNVPTQFSEDASFREQVLYVLSVLHKGSAGEVATELMELKGVSTEEGVAELTIDTARELEKLCEEGKVEIIRESGKRSVTH